MEAASLSHGSHHGPPPANRSSRVEPQLLGMLLFIISEIMVFGAFFTAYFFIRVVYGADWPAHVRLTGMAGFLLVLVAPDRLTTWEFDGDQLTMTELPEGTHLVTSGGQEDRKADRWLETFAGTPSLDGWRDLLLGRPPADDPAALTVRHERDGQVYGTVFAETVDAAPGRLRLEFSRHPWNGPWDSAVFGELPD